MTTPTPDPHEPPPPPRRRLTAVPTPPPEETPPTDTAPDATPAPSKLPKLPNLPRFAALNHAADRDPAPAEPASNPFVLPGLPSFTALDTDAVAEAIATADTVATTAAAGSPPPPPVTAATDIGDEDDPEAEVWPPRSVAAPLPTTAAAEVEGDGYAGDWGEWLGETTHRAPESAPSDPDDYDDEPYDDEPVDDDDYEIPDYDDPAALAEFRDRSGGTRSMVRRTPSKRVHGGGGRVWRAISAALAAAGVVTVVGVVVAVNLRAASDGPTAPGGAPAAADASGVVPTVTTTAGLPETWDHAVPGCTRTRTASVTIGADPGDTSSPQNVIMALEWAYYVDRSAAAVRALTTPDAAVPAEHAIQAGIDAQPPGARYCVYITAADTSGRVWDVELHEQWPGEEVARYGQTITTTGGEDGRTLITGIRGK